MSDEQIRLVGEIFDEALSLDPSERSGFVRRRAGADEAVAAEVLQLLEFDNSRVGEIPGAQPPPAPKLEPGTVLANRFELKKSLGSGGMGSVFEAFDRQLRVAVALKVIRPELSSDPTIRLRFRREVILARRITHPNVVRIYDHFEDGSVPFLTMELLEGQTLAAWLKQKGALSQEEFLAKARQLAAGLAAIHDQQVIHRDLKPQNVFITSGGNALLMDFGIARPGLGASQPLTTATRQGQMIGTVGYYSPEQVLGNKLTTATDVYSLGLIFHEMVTGKSVFGGVDSLSQLVRRAVEEPPAIQVSTPGLQAAALLIRSMLARSPEERPAAAQVLERLAGSGPAMQAPSAGQRSSPTRRYVVAASASAAALAGGYGVYSLLPKPRSLQTVRVLIADILNRPGDPDLNGTIESILGISLEDASFVTIFQRVTAKRIAETIRKGANILTEDLARLVAVREGLDLILSGYVDLVNGAYLLQLDAKNPSDGKVFKTGQWTATKRKDLLRAAEKAAIEIRESLGDTSIAARQKSEAETFSAASVEAAARYAEAQDFSLLGKVEDAEKAYLEAIRLDPGLGRAWSGLAVLYRNLGRTSEAVEKFRTAIGLMDRMTDRERYRTRGGYYVTIHNFPQALKEYEGLVSKYPADSAGHSNLALTYLLLRKTTLALQEGRKAIEIYPRNLSHRNNVALYALYAGDFAMARSEAERVLAEDPEFAKAYVAKALALLGAGQQRAARETWTKLAGVKRRGPFLSALGELDLLLAEGRNQEAARLAGQQLASATGSLKPEERLLFTALRATALAASGNASLAVASAKECLASGEEGTLFQAGWVLANAGRTDVQDFVTKISVETSVSGRQCGLLLQALLALAQGKLTDADSLLQKAAGILDSWLLRLVLGRWNLAAKRYVEASSELDACGRRLGEGLAVYIDDLPSYRFIPEFHFLKGSAELGLSPGSVPAGFKDFLAIRGAGADADDPLTRAVRAATGTAR